MKLALQHLDLSLVLLLRQHRFEPGMARLARAISRTGDGHLYALLGVLAWQLDAIHGTAFLLAGLSVFAVELPIYFVLKNTCRRHRPTVIDPRIAARIIPSDQFSFPSGHTTAAFVMATLIGHFYPQWHNIALCWASLIGLSRVMLGVHFPSDVIAGALLGTTLALLVC